MQKTVAHPRHNTPDSVRERLPVRRRFRFSLPERRVLRKRKKIPASQWAEQFRVVTMSSMPGRWSNTLTPYLAGIMDAAVFSSVQEVSLCAAPQVGKSEAMNNLIGYFADRDPGPVLVVYPDEQTARDNSRDRILPMFESSPRLRGYLGGKPDDASALRINLTHMPIYMAWARSASRLANKPIRYVLLDEVDKYPETAGKREADPISLAEKRTTTYKFSRKILKASTPTVESGPIWQALLTSEAVFHFFVRCPECGTYQLMEFDHIRWPESERDPNRVESLRLAWYECKHCEADWSDAQRDKAVRAGRWQDLDTGMELAAYLKERKPVRIGFHLPAWLSYFVSLSECAASFLRGQKSKAKLRDFQNAIKAEPWVEWRQERQEDRILALKDDRPAGLVPGGAAGLLATVDTQDNGFWYEIRAFGYGQLLDSWLVRAGFLSVDWRSVTPDEMQGRQWLYHPAFDSLRRVLWEDEYKDVDGNAYPVQLAVIDSQGHRTTEVYDFCRHHRGAIWPFKGEQRMAQLFSFSNIDTYPGTNKPIPGGVKLLRANATLFKGKLAEKLEIQPADPGAWRLHAEFPEAWAAHYTAEYQDDKGLWQCPDHKANHLWDCSYMMLVCAEVAGVRFWAEQGRTQETPAADKPGQDKDPRRRPGWFRNRK